MCGTSPGWPVRTSRLVTVGGRWWTRPLRSPARVHTAAVPLPSTLSATDKSTWNSTLRLSLLKWVLSYEHLLTLICVWWHFELCTLFWTSSERLKWFHCVSQVNSDRIYWQKKPDGSFSQVNVEKSSIGQRISTKAVGSDARVDITHLYKYPEGNKTHSSGPKSRASFLETF